VNKILLSKKVCDRCWKLNKSRVFKIEMEKIHGRNRVHHFERMHIDGPKGNIYDRDDPVELEDENIWQKMVTSCPEKCGGSYKFGYDNIPKACPYDIEHIVGQT